MTSNKKPTHVSIDPHDIKNHLGGWIPRDSNALKDWVHRAITEVEGRYSRTKGPDGQIRYESAVIQDFQATIEDDPEIYMYFVQMYQEIPPIDGQGRRVIDNYKTLLMMCDHYIHQAPFYEAIGDDKDVIGVPIYAILDPVMNTDAGAAAFRNPKVNAQFKRMFDVWCNFLVSPESAREVITTAENGWLGPAAIAALDEASGGRLQDLYVCDPSKPSWGFTSWDHFFTRLFRTDVPNPPRPVDFPDDDRWVNAACESTVLRIAQNVLPLDNFWIKGQPYSLNHMLHNDPLASQFVGGTVFQAFLSPLNYHRWNSPVNGRIIKAYVVPGTYYAAVPDDEGPGVLVRSQAFESALAARAIVFIESNNPNVGLMCFIAVGMAEVSSCDLAVRKDDIVKKGDELGTFHFGGSTHCLIFRPEANIKFVDDAQPAKFIKVKSAIGFSETGEAAA